MPVPIPRDPWSSASASASNLKEFEAPRAWRLGVNRFVAIAFSCGSIRPGRVPSFRLLRKMAEMVLADQSKPQVMEGITIFVKKELPALEPGAMTSSIESWTAPTVLSRFNTAV